MSDITPRHPLLLLVTAMFCALLGHFLQIAFFSHSLPYADQWDSEALLVFKPWLEGTLTPQLLLMPHNEHRILWKHLFDLLLFELNGGHWDNRVIALANTLIYAAAITVIFKAAIDIPERLARRLTMALCLLLPFTPFAYENTLWGFQSPFYMLALFGLLAVYLTAQQRFSPLRTICALLLGIAALFTMASGFFVAPVTAVLVATAQSDSRRQELAKYLLSAVLLGIGIAGYLAMPQLEHHAGLRVQSPMELIRAALVLLSWPVPKFPLLWLPLLFWLLFSVIYRQAPSRSDRFFAALALWTGLQAAALAYGRGHDMTMVPSRYTDMLVYGLVANSYFLARLLRHSLPALRPRLLLRASLVVSAVVVIGFAAMETVKFGLVSHNKRVLWQANHEMTAAMLAKLDVTEDNFALAYPNKYKLIGFLADPSIRAMLGAADGRLPDDCAVAPSAVLSRLACALTGPAPALDRFERNTAQSAVPLGLDCSLDLLTGLTPSDDLPAAPSSPLRFAGWVGPGISGPQGLWHQVSLQLTSAQASFIAHSRLRGPRPDVATVLNNPAFAWSGFDFTVSSAGLPPGEYFIDVVEDGRRCETGRSLRVR